MFEHKKMFFLFLLLPVLIALFVYDILLLRHRSKKVAGSHAAKIIPFYTEGQRWIRIFFYTIGFILAVFALARPRWGIETIQADLKGKDILVVLDVSFSMAAFDVVPSRMDAAKRYIEEILSIDSQDRVGLIVFSGESELVVPLTHDYGAVSFFLNSLYPGMLGKGGTDIAKAVIAGIDSFDDMDYSSKMILLMTDGEDLAGKFDSMYAKLSDSDIKVFTVGIGTAKGEPIPLLDEHGEIESFVKDEKNNPVISKLDETVLVSIAQQTGGSYMRTTGAKGEMKKFMNTVQSISSRKYSELTFNQKKDRYPIFLLPALLCFVIGFFLDQGRVFKQNENKLAWLFTKKFKLFIFILLLSLGVQHSGLYSQGSQPGGQGGNNSGEEQKQKSVKKQKGLGIILQNGGFWGNIHFARENYKKALDSYISATRNQEGNELAKLYYNIGNTFYKLGDVRNANKYYEMALPHVKEDSLKAMILYNQGLVSFKMKQYGAAAGLFKNVLILDDSDDDARYNYSVSKLYADEKSDNQNKDQKNKEKQQQEKQDGQNDQEQKEQKGQEQEQQLSEEQIQKLLEALDKKEKEENSSSYKAFKNQNQRGKYW